jgi:hypothetical protein
MASDARPREGGRTIVADRAEIIWAGKQACINIFQNGLTLEYGEYPLSHYPIQWQPDAHHFLRVGDPCLYGHPYQRPQLPLWEPGEVKWFGIIRAASPVRRHRKKGPLMFI